MASAAAAAAGDTVLLSPACASFDQYADFENAATISARWWRGWHEHVQPYVPGKRQPAHMPKGKLSLVRLKIWWREIDRVLLLLVLLLMSFGAIAVAAASPASADRLSTSSQTLDPLYFFYRHLAWQVLRWARCSACRC